ncbi:IS110 family RNA-guided transposase [Algiphilus aromaticivorans]|uniref:IS110 family transposase n=1 Tax=Algiphilus aromaticivorans TaxID=382454 RepID=UPI0005C1ED6E|nr:IS110 family transposase [Algiphilus aromaticivorans]
MKSYVGLDVSQKTTMICVVDEEGNCLWEGACDSHPLEMAQVLKAHAPNLQQVGLETGPLAVWHWHGLKDLGLPIVCLHARHAHAAIQMQVNKTDRNDARALAQIVRTGWYRPVAVKSMETHRIRLMLTARARVVSMRVTLYAQIRGLVKTFGHVMPPGRGSQFEQLVRDVMEADPVLAGTLGPLLELWCDLSRQLRKYDRDLVRTARRLEVCRRLMTAPGVGTLTALAFVTAIENPHRFRRSQDVGAYLGLTPRRYASGEVDRSGHISKCGDRMTRSLLFEAANVLITRSHTDSALHAWARSLRQRIGAKKAKVALARRLAVTLHRMWVDGTQFDGQRGLPAAA